MKNGNTKIIIWVISIVFLSGIAYATIYVNAGNICDNETEIKQIDIKVGELSDKTIGIGKDIYYIKRQVDTNAKVQEQILTEIRAIQK